MEDAAGESVNAADVTVETADVAVDASDDDAFFRPSGVIIMPLVCCKVQSNE